MHAKAQILMKSRILAQINRFALAYMFKNGHDNKYKNIYISS